VTGAAAEGAGRRIALVTVSFVVYAVILAPLGFVPATTLEFAVLARLFGGPLGKGALAGLAFALILYALFVYGLGLPLPLGVLEA
jgi:putative tricarboxylic transport membrane protein